MAHNLAIDEKTGQTSLYLLKEKAWHGLGQVVTEAKTSDEVIKLAHLDWDVVKVPNMVNLPISGVVESGSFSIVRKDNEAILCAVMGDKYTPVQNIEAFKFMDDLVMFKPDIIYETAGALGKGETVFVTAKLPGYIRIGKTNDVIERYLVWTNSHAGRILGCYFTDIRVVCNNTLSASIKDLKNGVTLKHTANVLSRVKQVKDLLDLRYQYTDELTKIFNALSTLRVDEKVETDFVNNLFLTPEELKLLGTSDGISTRKQNIINSVRTSIHTGPGQDMHKGTAFWLYNGLTSYFQNTKEYKTPDRKMYGITLGGDEAITTQRAFNQLVSMLS